MLALWFAVDFKHAAVADVLINRGCNLQLTDSKDPRDVFLLQSEATKGLTCVLQHLFDRGSSVDTMSRHGQTLLTLAAEAGEYNTVAFLLDRGANINAQADNAKDSSCEDDEEIDGEASEEGQGSIKLQHATILSPLICALEAGHAEVAKLLIERGANTSDSDDGKTSLALDQNAARSGLSDILPLLYTKENFHQEKSEDSETLLTTAAGKGDLESARFFLQKGEEVNARNLSGDTALSWVLRCGTRSPVVKTFNLLVDFGAEIHVKNDRSETPLQIASEMNIDEAVELPLELGCEVKVKGECSYSPLHHTARDKNGKLAEMLLKYCAEPNVQDYNQMTPLHVAVVSNSVHAARVLLEHGTDKEIINNLGQTPLVLAAVEHGNCNVDMVRLLVDNGSNVNARDQLAGKTPLMFIVDRMLNISQSLIKNLLDHGSIVNHTDQYGRSALHFSCKSAAFEEEINDLFFQLEAEINLPDQNNKTPLHFAASVEQTNARCLEWLVVHGADIRAVDTNYCTPLHTAVCNGQIRCAFWLIRHGDVNAADHNGWLPLHLAAIRGYTSLAQFLCLNGSSIVAVDNRGRTALDLATAYGHRELVQYLMTQRGVTDEITLSSETLLGAPEDYHVLATYRLRNFVEEFLDSGGDMFAIDEVTGRTTLHFAASSYSLCTLKSL